MDQPANNRRKILLIRHAQSAFNKAAAEAEQYKDHIDFKERVKEINFTLDLLDCNITDLGKEQAKKAAEKVKDRNITLIFTSPLRRCMQTAQEIFREHKNKIRVVVVPALREQLGATCDIADDLDKLQAEFPEHDFSLCNTFEHRKLWYIYTLQNEELRKTLFEEILSQSPDQEKIHLKAAEVIISKMRECFPDILERGKFIYDRVVGIKEWLFQEASKVGKGEEVAIVAHSVSLQCFTAMDIDQNGNLIGEKYLDNCEVYEFEHSV